MILSSVQGGIIEKKKGQDCSWVRRRGQGGMFLPCFRDPEPLGVNSCARAMHAPDSRIGTGIWVLT